MKLHVATYLCKILIIFNADSVNWGLQDHGSTKGN